MKWLERLARWLDDPYVRDLAAELGMPLEKVKQLWYQDLVHLEPEKRIAAIRHLAER